MLAEVLISLICFTVCCANIYVIAIFFVHRNNLTPKTMLQGNLAVSNLLSSYYLSAATVDEAIYGTGDIREDQSTGWNMTLCSLSSTSWALTSVLWYHANDVAAGVSKRQVHWNTTYGFIGAIWLYFTVLVLTHILSIYGWTFDSHDSTAIFGWFIFVLVPFLLPWILQAWIFIDLHPLLKPRSLGRYVKDKWQEMEKRGKVAGVEGTEEIVIEPEDKEDLNQQDQDQPSKPRQLSEDVFSIISNIFFSGFVAVLISTFAAKLFLGPTSEEMLSKAFIALVCITWINCSLAPFILFSGETEIEQPRIYVDSVLVIIARSVRSYVALYGRKVRVKMGRSVSESEVREQVGV